MSKKNVARIIRVNLKQNSYPVYIGYNLITKIPGYLRRLNLGNVALVITSEGVSANYKRLIKDTFSGKAYKIFKVPNGEQAKSQSWLLRAIKAAVKLDSWNRKLYIICLGGGTVGDLGGFVASIYKRGIPYVQIPTTLLGQIDSSIGGKTAIDLPAAKNILGSFYQPKAVFIDPTFLGTLSTGQIKQGISEALKYGIIKDSNFFKFLMQNHKKILDLDRLAILKMISVCVGIKAKIVVADEREKKGLRTILNFGHTFAHALESSLKYKKISHGEAVALGMLYAVALSRELKKCPKRDAEKVFQIIRSFSLPTQIRVNYTTLYKSISYDKKFLSGRIRMVILKKIGQVEVLDGISPQKIRKTLQVLNWS